MSQPTSKLTRAREAFIYSVRRRALRFAGLEGHGPEQARQCLQMALARFLPLSRQLEPGQWTACFWSLLIAALPARVGPVAFGTEATQAWQRDWDRLPLDERRAFLLQAWLRLPTAVAAEALAVAPAEALRRMARASLHLRQAGDAELDERERLARLCDGLERAPLAGDSPPAVPSQTPGAPRPRAAGTLRAVFAVLGGVMLAGGLWLSWPAREPLPPDLALPAGASGLVRTSVQAATLPEDTACLLDPDWPLWADPERAELIAELEFHAWLEHNGVD